MAMAADLARALIQGSGPQAFLGFRFFLVLGVFRVLGFRVLGFRVTGPFLRGIAGLSYAAKQGVLKPLFGFIKGSIESLYRMFDADSEG